MKNENFPDFSIKRIETPYFLFVLQISLGAVHCFQIRKKLFIPETEPVGLTTINPMALSASA